MIRKQKTISKEKVSELRKIMIGGDSPRVLKIKASQDSSSFSSESSGYEAVNDKFRHFYVDIKKLQIKTRKRDKTRSDGNLSFKKEWSSSEDESDDDVPL